MRTAMGALILRYSGEMRGLCGNPLTSFNFSVRRLAGEDGWSGEVVPLTDVLKLNLRIRPEGFTTAETFHTDGKWRYWQEVFLEATQ